MTVWQCHNFVIVDNDDDSDSSESVIGHIYSDGDSDDTDRADDCDDDDVDDDTADNNRDSDDANIESAFTTTLLHCQIHGWQRSRWSVSVDGSERLHPDCRRPITNSRRWKCRCPHRYSC